MVKTCLRPSPGEDCREGFTVDSPSQCSRPRQIRAAISACIAAIEAKYSTWLVSCTRDSEVK
jgi:hypothetical protein